MVVLKLVRMVVPRKVIMVLIREVHIVHVFVVVGYVVGLLVRSDEGLVGAVEEL